MNILMHFYLFYIYLKSCKKNSIKRFDYAFEINILLMIIIEGEVNKFFANSNVHLIYWKFIVSLVLGKKFIFNVYKCL